MERLSLEKLAAYLDGEVTTNEAREISKQIEEDGESLQNLRKLRNIRRGMKSAFDVSKSEQFCEGVTARISSKAAKRTRIGLRLAVAACAVLAISISAWQLLLKRDVESGAFVARGSSTDGAGLEKTAGFDAYLHPHGRLDERIRVRPNTVIAPGDGLSFVAYNRSGGPTFLMLFGVDADRKIHWFYPAPEANLPNLESIRLEGAPETVPLPDGVTPGVLPPGAFRVIALFTERPLLTNDVEDAFNVFGFPSLKASDPSAAVHETDLNAVSPRGSE